MAHNDIELNFTGAWTAPAHNALVLDFVQGVEGGEEPPPPIFRGIISNVAAAWGEGDPQAKELCDQYVDADKQRPIFTLPWQEPTQIDPELSLKWGLSPKLHTKKEINWDAGSDRHIQPSIVWGRLDRRDDEIAIPWKALRIVHEKTCVDFQFADFTPTDRVIPWKEVFHTDKPYCVRIGGSQFKPTDNWVIPWNQAYRPECVIPTPNQPPEPPDPEDPHKCWYPPDHNEVELVFDSPLQLYSYSNVPIDFYCVKPTPPPILRRVYIVSNSATLIRVSDSQNIPCTGMRFSKTRDSWGWTAAANLPDKAALDYVDPEGASPVLVEATINGYQFHALVEGYSESRSFPGRGYDIQGRSPAAELTSPYSDARSLISSVARNAQQLANDELQFTGWSLQWNTDDWLIPAGAFAYTDKTPLDAILRIAEAAGAYVNADRTTQQLIVDPAYPVSPWDWETATPDATLDYGLIIDLGRRWRPATQYHGVYVGGESQGVLVNVTRQGTSGSPYAQMVVDPLITQVSVGTERGRNIIARSGRKSYPSIRIPLLSPPNGPGLLEPGMLVEVTDESSTVWQAIVDSTTVTAARRGKLLEVYQEVTLERDHNESV